MYSSGRLQTLGVRLLSVVVCLVPFLARSAPSLRNVNITPGGENDISFLTADLRNGGGGSPMTFRINWGDGTPVEVHSYPAASPSISNHWHYYEDDNPTGTAGDVYTLSLSLSNNVGLFTTNVPVVITNVPPRLVLNVTSPIEPGSPATWRGLEIQEFPVPPGSFPQGIAAGPDGNIWFTETGANRVGKITTNGVVTQYPVGGGARDLVGIAAGSDNRLWFCAYSSGQIGAITTNGVATLYTIPRIASEPLKSPQYIIRGAGANMWYSDLSYRIGRITPAGVITQYVHQAGVNPWGLALGFDNNIWFTDYFSDTVNRLRPSDGVTTSYFTETLAVPTLMTRGPDSALYFTLMQAGKIGRMTTNGALSSIFVGRSLPYGITTGPDGAIWFTEKRSNTIARLTLDGQLSRYELSVFSDPREIVTGPDGALWFTAFLRDRIGRIRYTTFGNVLLSGNLNDPGYFDPHTVQIDWRDGSPIQTLNLAAGIASFHVTHQYSGSQGSYPINVTVTDDDTGVSSASAVVAVNAIRFSSITRSTAGEVRLKGTGASGRSITIEMSTDLQNWSSVGTVNSVSNAFEFVHPGSGGPTRFYRGKLP